MKNKKNKIIKKAASIVLVLALLAAPAAVFADSEATEGSDSFGSWIQSLGQWIRQLICSEVPSQSQDLFEGMEGKPEFGGQMPGQMGQMGSAQTADEASEIQTSALTSNSAEDLKADYANAETIVMSDSNNQVTISEAGTYIVTGTCADGNIKVKKGTQGVVLILKDLDLTSTTGATLSLNKGTETKVVIEGTVTLTDAEDTADEELDTYDGAAIKAKAGSSTVLTGTGTLNVNGNAEHGIKVSGTDADDTADGYGDASFIVDGSLKINVTAVEDGMNSGTDLTIKSGNITVSAGDDGIKADYILTIGEEGESGPTINVKKSGEALEGAVVNIYSGQIDVTASDDGINAANSDLSGYTFSINIMGGTVNVSAGADGLDSNGNINILGGLTTIVKAASNGGEGGVDYEGSFYCVDGCFVNPYGITMDSGMGGQMGGQMPEMNGERPEMPEGGFGPMGGHGGHGPMGQPPQGGMNGERPEMPEMNGEMPQMPQN
ncbi:MAG: carbohydrate-binding domain-containing protein [Firmicutes bacterium]|nr:carbohydrate-binding domain-containing protein [Bacillota bacterium]